MTSTSSVKNDEDFSHPDEINPFLMEYPMNWARKIEIAIGIVILLPIRLVATVLVLSAGLVMYHVAAFGLVTTPEGHYSKPILGWRRTLYDTLVPFLSRIWLYILGFWYIPFKGTLAKRDDAPIFVMAPHSSFMDGLVPLIFPRSYSPVTRFENRQVPVLGALLDVVAPIYIRRAQKESREFAQREILSRTKQKGWPPIMIFVEGTCSNRKALLPFKAGAFIPGAPVQPIILRYDGSPHCVWTTAHPLYLIFLTYCTLVNYASVEFLEPIVPTEEEKQDPQLFSDNVRTTIAKYLDIPLCSYGHRDFLRLQQQLAEKAKST